MKNLFFLVLFSIAPQLIGAQNSYDSLRYLVVFDESTPILQIDQIRQEHQAEEIWVSPFSQVRYWKSSGYPHYVGNDLIGDVKEEVKRLKSRPRVTGGGLEYEVISYNEVFGGSGNPPPIPCFENFQFNSLADTNSTIVSILDTGLSPQGTYPPELTFSYGNYTGYNYISDTIDLEDDHGHGTHIAGIISHVSQHLDFNLLNQSNIDFDIRKVFDSHGAGTISDIIYGFDEAVLLGAKVVNMSFVYYGEKPVLKPDPLEYSILKASQEQVLVVCAAGNEHLNNDVEEYPAFPVSYTCDNILSVGSVNCIPDLSVFSNYGVVSVDVTFLGESIPGPSPSGDIVFKSGASQATAVVSGIATAATSYLETPNYAKVKCAILNTVTTNQNLFGKILSSGVADALLAATIQALNSCNNNDSNHFVRKAKINNNLDWNISPNPLENETVLHINSPQEDNYKILISNLEGELILEKNYQFKKGPNFIPLDEVSLLVSGTYILKISNEKINDYKMFIKL